MFFFFQTELFPLEKKKENKMRQPLIQFGYYIKERRKNLKFDRLGCFNFSICVSLIKQ